MRNVRMSEGVEKFEFSEEFKEEAKRQMAEFKTLLLVNNRLLAEEGKPFMSEDWSYPYVRAQRAMNNAGTAAGRQRWEEAWREVSLAIRHLDDMRNSLPIPKSPSTIGGDKGGAE